MTPYVPFCGLPPEPGELLLRWTFDPLLLTILGALILPVVAAQKGVKAGVAGWALTAVLFVSPLCALSMALFSARVAQHLLLTLVAAPLLARALPRLPLGPLPFAGLFAVLFWVWHAPGPYGATLASDSVYWAMHLSLLGSATLYWGATLQAVHDRPLAAFAGVAVTAAQMTGLSVMLIVSQTPWHAWHGLTTAPWGMTAGEDQVLAGSLMWVAGALLMSLVVWLLALRFLSGGSGDPAFPNDIDLPPKGG